MLAKFLAKNLAGRIPFLENNKRTITVALLPILYFLRLFEVITPEQALNYSGWLTVFGGIALSHAVAKKKAK